jgi:rhodanese-related sulfurtransferase
MLDDDMAVYVKEYLEKQGIIVLTNININEISECNADIVLLSAGVRPNTTLAKQAGIELGIAGAIKVNAKMQTNLEDIYACGDCTEQYHLINGKAVYRPLGSTANKTGRIAGDQVTGGSLEFKGILGTGIFKIFDMTVAQTGLSEKEAREQGYEIAVCHNIKPNKPEYMGGKEMIIKAVADKQSGRLLGAQIVGFEGVDKRIDIFAAAITFKAKAEDLFHLDLAYAPPFSTTKDPVMYTGMILDNAINKGRPLITPNQLNELINSNEDYTLIDARVPSQYEKNHIKTAKNIPHSKLRETADTLDKDTISVTYCNKGVTGNAAQNILLGKGFKKVYNLSGGQKQFSKTDKE